jgi:hypothetical protein
MKTHPFNYEFKKENNGDTTGEAQASPAPSSIQCGSEIKTSRGLQDILIRVEESGIKLDLLKKQLRALRKKIGAESKHSPD